MISHKYTTNYDQDGNICQQYNEINGKIEGIFKQYYNGVLKWKMNYKNGLKNGLSVYLYDNYVFNYYKDGNPLYVLDFNQKEDILKLEKQGNMTHFKLIRVEGVFQIEDNINPNRFPVFVFRIIKKFIHALKKRMRKKYFKMLSKFLYSDISYIIAGYRI